MLWISNTLYTSKFCFGLWLSYLFDTVSNWFDLCFTCTLVQLIRVFYRFLYLFAQFLHILLVLSSPGCNITSLRWIQPWVLHLRVMLQFGHIVNYLSTPWSAVSPFDLNYTFIDSKFGVMFALVGLGICVVWASSYVWIGLCY